MKKHEIAVILSGLLWGTMGVFRRTLGSFGLETSGLILVRCSFSALAFILVLLVKNPKQLKVKPKDFWCFLGTGVFSLLFFTFCYFQAISLTSLAMAAILLYTAPAIVMLLSALFFKEKLTKLKLLALLLSVVGCALVSGIGGSGAVSAAGVLFGLGAGLGYALYSIFARFALQRGYGSNTINAYSCLLASLGSAVIWGCDDSVRVLGAGGKPVLLCVIASLVTCFLPYMLYTYGLSGMENGKASVLASLEPVMAAVLGALIYHEILSPPALLGMVMVMTAILLLNKKSSVGKTPSEQ